MNHVNCQLTVLPLDVAALRKIHLTPSSAGGFVCFEGIIRDHNDGKGVECLFYESYETLALKELHRIGIEAAERFSLSRVDVWHRTGKLDIGDTAVVVMTSSAHRNEAFLGNRYVIDELKKRVPIWKRETYKDGTLAWTRCSHANDESSHHTHY